VGVNTDYLGHVEIVPSLNQAECDYLVAFARSRRSYRPGGPYAVIPEDPHTGSSEREVGAITRWPTGSRASTASAVEPKSLYASRRPGTHLAAFSSVDIQPGIPPWSALRCTHLNDAKRKGTWVPRH
jgi:hypothetical protein